MISRLAIWWLRKFWPDHQYTVHYRSDYGRGWRVFGSWEMVERFLDTPHIEVTRITRRPDLPGRVLR